jgi:hypothetical protein
MIFFTTRVAKRKVPGVVVGFWIPGEGTYVVTRGCPPDNVPE